MLLWLLPDIPADDILELFGKTFFEFCQDSGYDKILQVLGATPRDFLQVSKNNEVYNKFYQFSLPFPILVFVTSELWQSLILFADFLFSFAVVATKDLVFELKGQRVPKN